MFSMDDSNICMRYNGVCAPSDSTSGTTDIYSKSGFYADPKKENNKCTHYQAYQEDDVIASYCMAINEFTAADGNTAKTECEYSGNCHVAKTGGADQSCDSGLIASSIVPETGDVAYTLAKCTELCYN